ncbi:unnamed protein product [Psylliodes chrysocephalus]|uniref:Solute carrier family 46 member 3 n=1 Tax=Psylliodes chrysocephalus TaxID=3402493 RepID=A0A9P0CK03_9CUCU|nr:unnamed protein product [Psylliodes chrysocephala]
MTVQDGWRYIDSEFEENIEKHNETGTNSKVEKSDNNLRKTLKKVAEILTVEPLVGIYQLAICLSKPALDNLELEKACRVNLRYNDTVCNAILTGHHRRYSEENNNIQVIIGKMHSWQQPVQSFMPLLLILFLGSYSDRHKLRKPFFIIPIIGDLLGNIGCIFCVLNMTSWPIEVQGVFQKIVPSFFGTQSLLTMSTTAYVADISSVESRTFRIGLTTLVISVVVPVANAISGILFLQIGYHGVLCLSSMMLVSALMYGMLWVKESTNPQKNKKINLFADVLSPKHALDTFKIIFKKTQELKNMRFLLLLVILHRSAFDGETNVLYLYVQNVFQWTPVDFTYFLTVNSTVTLIGNILGICLLVKILNAGDLIILFITVFTRILSNLLYGLATTPEIFYLGAFMSVVTKLYRIVKRSYATKIVSTDDIGKTQSLLGIAEALAPALSVPVYNLLYMHTLKTFPASIFFFSIIIYFFCCLLILWMYLKNKNCINKKIDRQGDYKTAVIETTHM